MQPFLPLVLTHAGRTLSLSSSDGRIWASTTDIARTLGVDLPPDQREREIILIVPPNIEVPHDNPVFLPASQPPPFCEGCAARIWWEAPVFVGRELHPLVVDGPLKVWELNALMTLRSADKISNGAIRDYISNGLMMATILAVKERKARELAAKKVGYAKGTVEEAVEENSGILNVLPFPRPKDRK